jgi:peptidoglycan/LPS O-acetylase OafA/YrhL
MRGGALVVLVWSLLLLVLFVGHWLYAGEGTQIAITAGSVGVIVLWGALGALLGREALRRGPPPPRRAVEAVPDFSFAAGLIGFSIASIGFGFAWGHFLTYFGLGLLVISLVRLGIELRSQRETLRAHVTPAPGDVPAGARRDVGDPPRPGEGGRA